MTTRNWNVNDLRRLLCCILSWEKTLMTSPFNTTSTTGNRNVNNLLDSALLKKDTIVGTSTNCSASCGAMSTLRECQDEGEILGTSITCSGIWKSRCRHTSPAAQEYRGSGPWAPRRRAGPVPVVPAARPGWPAALPSRRLHPQTTGRTPGEEGRVVLVLVPLLSSPGHHRALCAVVQLLGQGHRDGHPLMSHP